MLGRLLGVELPRAFPVVVLTTVITVLGTAILAPALPRFSAEFELSGAATAMLLTANSAGRLVMTVPGGALTDRLGYGVIALAALVVAAASALVAVLVPTFGIMLGVQVVQGLAGGAMATAGFAAIVGLAGAGEVGRVVSVFQGSVVAAMTLSPSLGGAATRIGGVTGPFWALFVLEVLAVGVLLVALRRRVVPWRPTATQESDGRDRWRAVGAVVRSRPFLLSFAAAFILAWTLAGTRNTLIPLFGADAFDLDSGEIGLVLTIVAAAGVPMLLLAGRALDRYGRRPVIRLGTLLAVASTAALAVSPSAWVLTLIAIVMAVAIAVIAPTQSAVVSDLARPDTLATAVGVSRLAQPLAFVVGPAMAGLFVDVTDPRTAFLLAAAFLSLLAIPCQAMPETLATRTAQPTGDEADAQA